MAKHVATSSLSSSGGVSNQQSNSYVISLSLCLPACLPAIKFFGGIRRLRRHRSRIGLAGADRRYLMMDNRKKQKRPAHAPLVGNRMTDDLVIGEILPRLPSKSLGRFRCVSKAWNSSIISHQKTRQVSGLYICRFLRNPTTGLFCASTIQAPARRHLMEDDFACRLNRMLSANKLPSLYMNHSCNGLLLFVRKDKALRYYYVWNQTTMEFVALPTPPRDPKFCTDAFLAFDPRESPHYKVVRCSFSGYSIFLQIYSSLTRSWDELTAHIDGSMCLYPWLGPQPVFHKGALYMILPDRHNLLRFEVDNKRNSFHPFESPKDGRGGEYCKQGYIGVSRGHLYYVVVDYTPLFHVYMLLDDNQNWLLTHKMDTKLLRKYPMSFGFRLLGFHPESEEIYLKIKNEILSYHPSRGRLEKLCKFPEHMTNKVMDLSDMIIVYSISPCPRIQ